jgi:hypothetical protein
MVFEAIILCSGETAPIDRQLARLTEFWGIQTKTIDVGAGDALSNVRSCLASSPCVMLSARSLAAIFQDAAISPEVAAGLFGRTPFVLVYGITPDEQESSAVRHLTKGAISSVVSFDRSDYQYHVSPNHLQITQEFSGLSFGPIDNQNDCGLLLSQPLPGFSELVSINNLPIFASLEQNHSRIFLLAAHEIVNLNSKTNGSLLAHKYFSRFVPVSMFLKLVFKNHLWHSSTHYANLIIDDPLLKKSYGFLNYQNLLDQMDEFNFATTIAFIPWNYKRTSPVTAQLFHTRSDKFSICVHGCDHTEGEFASGDVAELNAQLSLAERRMIEHEHSTGVSFAKVMVFPQGKFSTTAFGPLKSHNFLAAVNSSSVPEDLQGSHTLTVADLLDPAISKYNNFPLFMRRYPRRIADFALDLFLGKPALIVEHHTCFRNGYDDIKKFVAQVNSLSKKLQWADLQTLIYHTSLQKEIDQDTIACRIFSSHQILHNDHCLPKQFIIMKREDEDIMIKSVSVNMKQQEYVFKDGHLVTHINLPPKSSAEVEIKYNNLYGEAKKMNSFKKSLSIYIRRHLSELKDNYLSNYHQLLAAAYRIKHGGL